MSVVTNLTTPRSCGTVVTSLETHIRITQTRVHMCQCVTCNATAVMALQEADRGGEAIAIHIRFVIPTATCHVTMWRDLLQRRACSAHAQTPSASLRHEASKRHLLYVIEQGHGRSGNNRLQISRARNHTYVTPLDWHGAPAATLGEEEKEERKGKKERGGGG